MRKIIAVNGSPRETQFAKNLRQAYEVGQRLAQK